MPTFLTDALISTLRSRKGRFEVADSGAPGLRLRRTKTSDLIWSLWYRRRNMPDSATRYRLGRYAPVGGQGLTLAAARRQAREWTAKIEKGEDPQGDLQAIREAERERRRAPKPDSVADLVARALASARQGDSEPSDKKSAKRKQKRLRLRPATLKEWSRRAKVDIFTARFAHKPAATLSPTVVETWLAEIAERSGHSANSARTVLLRCYSWAIERQLLSVDGKILTVSPIATVPKPDEEADEKESERVLSKEELRAVLLALDEIEAEGLRSRVAYADAARLLLLTGVRRSAVLGMKRSEIQGLGSSDASWTVPGERSKNGKPHVVPLSKQAASVIERRLAVVETSHLFPQFQMELKAVEVPMTWSSRFVEDLKKRADRILGRRMEAWKIHNFRSALATNAREKLKVSSDVVSRLLSHTPPGPKVTRIYDRSELLDERREALVDWARWLDKIKTGEDANGATVVPIHGRRAS